MEMIDARLADGQTDGWRQEDVPEDGQAWRDTLAHLDSDAKVRHRFRRLRHPHQSGPSES